MSHDLVVSAWEGNSRKIHDLVRQKKLIILPSDDMEKEFIRVLGYDKFGLSPKEIMPAEVSQFTARGSQAQPITSL
jgi:predicted nucleic acid-binding protein